MKLQVRSLSIDQDVTNRICTMIWNFYHKQVKLPKDFYPAAVTQQKESHLFLPVNCHVKMSEKTQKYRSLEKHEGGNRKRKKTSCMS